MHTKLLCHLLHRLKNYARSTRKRPPIHSACRRAWLRIQTRTIPARPPPFQEAGWHFSFFLSFWALSFACPTAGDIEFKYDEAFMFSQTQTAGISQPVPTLGMESSVGIRNRLWESGCFWL